jgi:ribose transport system permease protein
LSGILARHAVGRFLLTRLAARERERAGALTTATAPERRKPRLPPAQNIAERFGVVLIWIVLIVVFAFWDSPDFFTQATFQNIFGSQAVLLVLALALMIPLIVGEFDLSIVGTMSVSLSLVGYLNVLHHWAIGPAVIVAMLAGLVIGLINAFFVISVGVESIVVTLGAGTLWTGVGYAIYSTTIPNISQTLINVTTHSILGLPLVFWYAVGLVLVMWYVLSFTPIGRYLYFVGANRSVSLLSGIPVNRIRASALILSAFLSGVAGVALAGTLGSSSPSVSDAYLLPAFAAVFLGTTVINPGRFNPFGTFVAVYFLTTGITGLELHGLTGWIEDVFYGGSLVIAVALSQYAARRGRRKAGMT